LPGKGSTGTDVRTVVSGSSGAGTNVEFRWFPSLKKYVRFIDGVKQIAADGKPVATPNVIVQQCQVTAHPADTDVNGNPSQFTRTVGTGKVTVFRDGRRFDGTWKRKNLGVGTTLIAKDGSSLTLSPGGAWFALVRNGTKTSGA
jgi:hypothetical protein